MSVITGENLIPPLFSKSFQDNLVEITIPTALNTASGSPEYFPLGTIQLEQGQNYLIVSNLVTENLGTNTELILSIYGNTANDAYPIYNQIGSVYDGAPNQAGFYTPTITRQGFVIMSPPVTQTYSLSYTFVYGGTPSPLPQISPSSSGSLIQILQLSEN
jgi:hypothetical protein